MKKLIACLLAVITVTAFGITCFAAEKPSWFPEDVSSFQDYHNEGAPKVVDDADIFTSKEEAQLTAKINDIVSTRKKDLVIYTTPSSYDYADAYLNLAADFYQFNGYGIGDDYSGLVFMVCMEPGNRGWATAACGSAQSLITSANTNIIDDSIDPYMRNGQYYDAACVYLDKIDTLFANGTLTTPAQQASNIGIRLIIAVAIGLVVGLIVMLVLSRGMNTVHEQTTADAYIVPGSFNLRVSRDHFLYRNVTRVKRENNNGGKGGSSFSGGFSSSGGRSFSGSSRKF